jgi:PAS domain S-box-containing protein
VSSAPFGDGAAAAVQPSLHAQRAGPPLPAITWATDADLLLTWLSGELPEELTAPEEAIGLPFLEAFPLGDHGAVAKAAHRRALEGRASNFEFGLADHTYAARVQPIVEDGEIVGVTGIAVDVTEGRLHDAARVESEAQFRMLVERVPAITYTAEFGSSGMWHYVSPQVESVLGYRAEEWMDDPTLFFSRIHPDDQPRYLEAEEESRTTGRPFSLEYRMLARDGREVWMRDDGVVVPESLVSPAMLHGVMFDVTKQSRAEQALRESEDRYRSLVDLSPDAIFVHSDGRFVFANHAAARLLGADAPGDLLGMDVLRIVHPDYRDVVQQRIQAENEGRSVPLLEERFVRLDGSVIEVEVAGIPLTYEGRTAGQIVVRDVTERKRVERRLLEAEGRYRSLVETIPMVTYIVERGEGGRTLYVSPQIERMIGYTPEECLPDRGLWHRILHPDDRDRVLAEDRLRDESEEPFSAEYRVIAKDGRTVWVRNEAVLLPDESGRGRYWQGVMIDVTARKRAEEDLQRALQLEREAGDRLRALDEMKNTFLHAVSHELRTPLAAVLGFALTLERSDLRLSEDEARDISSRIASNARKLERLLTDLLDLDRLDRGIVEPKLHPTDLGALVRRQLREYDLPANRFVEVVTEPVVVPLDPAKVERIVENLVVNSLRHTPPGTHVWVRVEAVPRGALLTIEDDGPGVPEELREAVFEPFLRGPDAPSHSPGVGVGLSLVARFAALHGGRSWVEEREGGGASFRVFLPE